MDTYIGFDSAWTDNQKAPGAICAVTMAKGREVAFESPRLVSFDGARSAFERLRSPGGVTLLAIDQPTIVPNATGMRPVERAAASLVSWLGGGVQPSNRTRKGMFCDAAPIWPFLASLGAVEDPEAARTATAGHYVMEVFPALAVASFDAGFFGRLAGPRYNPSRRRTFRLNDWVRVAEAAARGFQRLGCAQAARWCSSTARLPEPRKADQDRLDAALCTLIALHWRRRPREESILLGDLVNGYMVLPASTELRDRIAAAAGRIGVPIDRGASSGPERGSARADPSPGPG
ncbi:DUF429 domain-containing protein [Paracraurococcus ruber]|uniref:DUF429 domain-containing protein n=1 Tax=Paracraurococcus ruber TaxID=77675 RepID=A0ABS1CR51_9PROT|nr:DUF429 domain-containing protein [Paracraurococcus ruber]MBK1656905.1 DUF429 domain-containing protein [Paracraurococcus ruber]TDG33302.1 DUF429 domain-containing protein [Paracraurococcus ruber]